MSNPLKSIEHNFKQVGRDDLAVVTSSSVPMTSPLGMLKSQQMKVAAKSPTISVIRLSLLAALVILLMPTSLFADSSWIRRPSNSTTDLWYVSFGSSGFLAGGSNTLLYSTDGISWSKIDAPRNSNILNTTSNGNNWIVSDINQGHLYTYTFGGAFTNLTTGGPFVAKLATLGNTVVAAGRGGIIRYTTDGGGTWLLALSPTQTDISAITTTQNGFIAIAGAGEILTSTDGIYWNRSVSTWGNRIPSALSSGSNSIVFTWLNYAYRTIDGGINWIPHEITSQSNNFNDIEYGNGSFMAVGNGGKISISRDQGITWSSMESSVSADLRSIAYGNGRWVATGSNGVVLTLDDSVSNLEVDLDIYPSVELRWNSQTGVIYRVYSSPDLKTWNEEGSPIVGNGSWMSKYKTIEGTRRFFRISSN